MRKKALILGAALVLSAMTFVGCGNQDNNNAATDQETSSSPDATDNMDVGEEPSVSPDDNGGVVDDLEEGAKDVGDAVGDAVDDLDGEADNAMDDTAGDNAAGDNAAGGDTAGKDTAGKDTAGNNVEDDNTKKR